MRRLAFCCLAVLLGACQCDRPLVPVPSALHVEPSLLEFGRVPVGSATLAPVRLRNEGKVGLVGRWRVEGEGFSFGDGVPTGAVVGQSHATVSCAPLRAGFFEGRLEIALEGVEPIVVPLLCDGIEPPRCAAGSCEVAHWDAAEGRCVVELAAEGAPCGMEDVCLEAASCRAGRCVGTPRGCDDHDPCTVDGCSPSGGCGVVGSVSCPTPGPCRTGVCLSGVGCSTVEAPDGTPCGPSSTCDAADVCISGECVRRDPPDGFVCRAKSPCAEAGTCVGSSCEGAPPQHLAPSWSWSRALADGGIAPNAWSDLFADLSGQLMLSSYFVSPLRLQAASSTALDLSMVSRRCLWWLDWVVCGDLPSNQRSPVSAVDPRTGALAWSFSGARELVSQLAEPRAEFFLARLAVLSQSELLVLYERRVMRDDGSDPLCRSYAMVVLDRQGQALRSRFIEDPIFAVCTHPHSYGVATDSRGDVYLSFSPSFEHNPARPLTGTTLLAFTSALTPKWRVSVPGLRGGELAVAHGALFAENGRQVRSLDDGGVRFTLPTSFGLGVIAEGNAVWGSATTLAGLNVSAGTTTWERTVSDGFPPNTPLFAASWEAPWGTREIVGWVGRGEGGSVFRAVEALTGAPAFECPLGLDGGVSIAMMTAQGLALMHNRGGLDERDLRCDDCDPRFAQTRNDFVLLATPGVRPSTRAAWSATWGDAQHRHHER